MEKSPLSQLLGLAQQREDVERDILRNVAKARGNGSSWQEIANVIGGTKQAAQQRYGKAVEPLLENGKYECSCGWTIVYPMFEATEARADIDDHEMSHELDEMNDSVITDNGDGRDDYGTLAIELSQLAGEPAIFLDGSTPAIFRPQRTDAPQADRDEDETMNRIEAGELDTEGFTIDWSQKLKNGICPKCSMTHHYEGKGRNLYFWIGPECTPTHRDDSQHRPRITGTAG